MIKKFKSSIIKVFPSIHRDANIDINANLQTPSNLQDGIINNVIDERNSSISEDNILVNKFTITNNTINIPGREISGINKDNNAVESTFKDYLMYDFIVDDLAVDTNTNIDNKIYVVYKQNDKEFYLSIDTSDNSFGSTLKSGMLPGIEYIKELYIPSSITTIEEGALKGASNIETLVLPFIGESAKNNGASSKTVLGYIFGKSVFANAIETSQQYSSGSIVTYYIPQTLKTIKFLGETLYYGSFSNCINIENVDFSQNKKLSVIEDNCFYGCSKLESINLPKNLTTIGKYAFYNCSKLLSVNLPESITKIDIQAFYGCSLLKTVFINNEEIYSKINSASSYGYLIANASTINVLENVVEQGRNQYLDDAYLYDTIIINKKSYESYSLVEDESAYPKLTFTSIDSTTASVSAKSTIITSGDIVVPKYIRINNRKYIVNTMSNFTNCDSMTSINVPSTITTINNNTFTGCTSLDLVTIESPTIYSALTNKTACGNLIQYASDVIILKSVVDNGSNTFLNNVGNYTRGQETIDGIDYYVYTAVEMFAYTFNTVNKTASVRAGSPSAVVNEITIPTTTTNPEDPEETYTVTSIESDGFKDCVDLTIINIPNSIETLGGYSFSGCTHLTSVQMNNVVTLGEHAFDSCNALTSISLPSTLTTIGNYAFVNSGLTSLTIPNSVVSIGNYAFDSCSHILEITFTPTSSLTTIGSYAFRSCTGIESIELPTSLTSIGQGAFYYCNNLQAMLVPFVGGGTFGGPYFGYIFGASSSSENNNYVPQNLGYVEINSTNYNIPIRAFYGCSNIEEIILSTGMMSIGDSAFADCSSLGQCTIPSGTTTINSSAFKNCTSLKYLILPASILTIGLYAFENCSALISATYNGTLLDWLNIEFSGSFSTPLLYTKTLNIQGQTLNTITIPQNTTTIKPYTFYSAENVTSLTLNNSLTTISSGAFGSCKGLTSITIPASVTTLGEYAFGECDNITSITFEQGSNLTSVGVRAFISCGISNIIVPNTVTSIGQYAFNDCRSLTSITLPFVGGSSSSNQFIGYIFGASTSTQNNAYLPQSLTNITITGGTAIENEAFYGCSNLTSVTLPGTITTIGVSAFDGCSGLSSFVVPTNTTTINNDAFNNCTHLAEVTLQNVTIYNALTSATACGKLIENATDIKIAKSIADSGTNTYLSDTSVYSRTTTIIGSTTYYIYTKLGMYQYTFNTSTKTATIRQGNPSLLVGNITLPSITTNPSDPGQTYTVTSVGSFQNCIDITNLTVPSTVTTLLASALRGCTGLISVSLSSNLTTIGNSAFDGCTSLTNITIPSSVTSIGSYAFNICSALTAVNISSLESWCLITFGNYFANPLYYAKTLYMNNIQVSSITIPNTISELNDYVFVDCESLTQVTLPSTIRVIGNGAFSGCKNLTTINIPSGVTSIGNYAFDGCSYLQSIFIPNTITSIGHSAFSTCARMTTCTFEQGSTLSTINSNTFLMCTSLTTINLPDTITSIGLQAFAVCHSLTGLTLPSSLTSIGDKAFQQCWDLGTITIPANVTNIGSDAFSNVSLTAAYILPTTPPSVYADSFEDSPYYTYPLYVPSSSLTAYQNATGWSSYGNRVQAMPAQVSLS